MLNDVKVSICGLGSASRVDLEMEKGGYDRVIRLGLQII
jgi:hypothetical protein